MNRTLPAHLVPIAERISREDYTVLRDRANERLVFEYARQIGVGPAALIRSWAPSIDDVIARRNAQPEPVVPVPVQEPEDEDDVDDADEDDRDREPEEPDIDVDDAGGDLDDEEDEDDVDDDDDQEERRRR